MKTLEQQIHDLHMRMQNPQEWKRNEEYLDLDEIKVVKGINVISESSEVEDAVHLEPDEQLQ